MAYELLEDVPETGLTAKNLITSALQVPARAFETVAGTPGNLLSILPDVGNYLSGGKIPDYKQIRQNVPFLPPTSQEFRQQTQNLTGQELEPQSETGKYINEAVEGLANFALPLGTGSLGLSRAIATSFLAPAAGKVVKELTGSDTGSALAKTLVTLGGEFGFRNKQFNNIMKGSYDKFRDVTTKVEANAQDLQSKLSKLGNKISRRDMPDKKFLLDRIDEAEQLIMNGKINPAQALDRRIDLNSHLRSTRLEKEGYKDLNELTGYFRDWLKDYSKINKDAGKYLKVGDEIFSATQEANRISSTINRVLPKGAVINKILEYGAVTGLTGGIPALASYFPSAAAATVGGIGAKTAYDIGKFMTKSSAARQLYGKILRETISGNISALKRDSNRLDKIFESFSVAHEEGNWELLAD